MLGGVIDFDILFFFCFSVSSEQVSTFSFRNPRLDIGNIEIELFFYRYLLG